MKRTARLDSEKEVLLYDGANGPIFTTKADLELTESEKEELSQKINTEGPFRQLVEKWTKDVLTMQMAFVETVMTRLNPRELERFNCVFDGEVVAARSGEVVLAVFNPSIPKNLQPAVRLAIQEMRQTAKEMDDTKARLN